MLNEISYSAASKHFKTGQYTEALSTLNQLIDTKRDARTYALLAKTCLRPGTPAPAATSYALASQPDGMDAESYLVESIKLYFDCGQKDKALALSNKLIHKFHKYPDITYIVGTVLLERGEPRIARALKNILMKSDTIEH
ncbi:hypothetical protein D1623_29045, partial [Klebsiella pneumoniae]|uniref:tetratricopeptide repeat protein n=1 Tax=Klebsiella pneumoniae TaxID=573 RepID=UPI000FF361BE